MFLTVIKEQEWLFFPNVTISCRIKLASLYAHFYVGWINALAHPLLAALQSGVDEGNHLNPNWGYRHQVGVTTQWSVVDILGGESVDWCVHSSELIMMYSKVIHRCVVDTRLQV